MASRQQSLRESATRRCLFERAISFLDPIQQRRYEEVLFRLMADKNSCRVSAWVLNIPNMMRMHMRRFTRLTNAFSKKPEHHAYSVALHQMYYNFVRIHQTLKVAPAMAAGVSQKLWEVSDIVAMVEDWEVDRAATGVEYQVEREKIGDGYLVRKLVRYGEPKTVFGFGSPGEAEGWIEADRASRRPGPKRKHAN